MTKGQPQRLHIPRVLLTVKTRQDWLFPRNLRIWAGRLGLNNMPPTWLVAPRGKT